MQSLSINMKNQAHKALLNIKKSIHHNENIFNIDANFYFTKGEPGRAQGSFLRDIELENEVKRWLKTRVSFDDVMSRYEQYYPQLSSLEWPRQYATRFINIKGKAAASENIFMFFPEVLGLNTGVEEDYFGFEFVDVWVSIFDEIIFPCVRKVFDEETQIKLFTTLRPALEKTIYLASVFHEIGHRCGHWRVSPIMDPRVKINKFNTDVLGELATDSLMLNFTHEFPEILYFIFLQRTFWFGRFGYKSDPVHGKLNEDNDTWIGSYLWNKYIDSDALTQNSNNKWHLNFDKLTSVFFDVVSDIDQLGDDVIRGADKQDNIINAWMDKKVEKINGKYVIPESLQEIFIKCMGIDEKPVFKY